MFVYRYPNMTHGMIKLNYYFLSTIKLDLVIKIGPGLEPVGSVPGSIGQADGSPIRPTGS